MPATETLRLCVTVKAYPAVSTRHGEVVCVAGIRTDTPQPEWVRLWPIDFRGLERTLRFEKYEEVSVRASRNPSDTRPESWRPETESLIPTGRRFSSYGKWRARRALVEPLMAESMCSIQQRQRVDGTSLGVFRPAEIIDLVATPNTGQWTAKQLGHLNQLSFLAGKRRQLQRVPYDFKFRYRCDSSGCKTHLQGIVDWELMQAYRAWTGGPTEKLDKVRSRWLGDLCSAGRDTAFFVGNQHQGPQAFLVLGVFWPPHDDQLALDL